MERDIWTQNNYNYTPISNSSYSSSVSNTTYLSSGLVGETNSTDLLELDYAEDASLELIQILKDRFWDAFMEMSTVLPNNTAADINLLSCFDKYLKSQLEPEEFMLTSDIFCPVKFDGISCWPATPPGILRSIPCFEEFNGLFYDSSGK